MSKLLKVRNSEKFIFVNDIDYEKLCQYRYYHGGNGCGHIQRFYHNGIKTIAVSIANDIFETNKLLYDHKDRNPFNCQRDNLRVSSYSQNQMNKAKRLNCSSKYKGVCWAKKRQLWFAYLTNGKDRFNLGFFKFENVAALAYDFKARLLFGEFANLNFN